MRAVVRWHRRIGLFAAALVFVVTLTGLALQHTGQFGLNRVTVTNRAITSLYFDEDPEPALALRGAGPELVWRAGMLYSVAAQPVPLREQPVGAVDTQTGIVIATARELYVLSRQGALVEHLDASLLPGAPAAIGRSAQGTVVLRAASGVYAASEDLAQFRPHTAEDVRWSSVEPVAPNNLPDFVARAAPTGLPLDRILLDLHTGRLFGPVGVVIVNAASAAFLILAVTGLITALRRNGGRRER
jgi:hypothetical protein